MHSRKQSAATPRDVRRRWLVMAEREPRAKTAVRYVCIVSYLGIFLRQPKSTFQEIPCKWLTYTTDVDVSFCRDIEQQTKERRRRGVDVGRDVVVGEISAGGPGLL